MAVPLIWNKSGDMCVYKGGDGPELKAALRRADEKALSRGLKTRTRQVVQDGLTKDYLFLYCK